MPGGVTTPHLIDFDDGQSHVVKFKGNPVGTQVLIKELVVSMVADELRFSHKRGNIVQVGQTFVNSQPELSGFQPGLQFGSPDLGSAFPFDPAHFPNLANKADLAQVLVLDTLFCNRDRHTGNILMVYEDELRNRECRFYIVDHSHVLGHDAWGEGVLRGFLNNTNLYVSAIDFNYVPRNISAFDLFLARLEDLDTPTIRRIVDSVPHEWGMTTAEADALKELTASTCWRTLTWSSGATECCTCATGCAADLIVLEEETEPE